MEKNVSIGLLVLRVAIAGPMLMYGISKVFNGIAPIEALLDLKGLPGFMSYGVYVGEVIAPILLLLGFRSRIAAGLFAINALTALLLAHPISVISMNANGGWAAELLGIYFLVAVALFFTGGGNYALSSNNVWD